MPVKPFADGAPYHLLMQISALRFLCVLSFAVLSARAVLGDENENRARVTLERMESVATAVAAYLADHNEAPNATTVEALVPLLTPTYIREVPLRDGWETPLRYERLGAQSFRIVSAGADRRFDEQSWNTAAQTEDLAADAVYVVKKQYEAGAFHRFWMGGGGSRLRYDAEAMRALAQPLVDSEIEKMKAMSPAQSFSYLRTSATLRDLEAVGIFLDAYRMKYGRYPAVESIAELQSLLFPDVGVDIPKRDKWGTELRYVVSPDGKSYRLISAGEDAIFDETSWSQKGWLASTDDDAVLENGEVVRRWTTETQPGFGPRAKLQPKARTLLAQADERLAAQDHAGALQAYIEAVKADRAAADLDTVRRYAPPAYGIAPPPPPGPDALDVSTAPAESRAAATAVHIAALRQFLELHPGDADAERELAMILPDAEAVAYASKMVKARPRDPELYRLRAQLRFRAGQHMEGLADLEHATTLDPGNAELFYMTGVAAYEMVSKRTGLSTEQKRDLIRRGFAAFDRAESLRADFFESLSYRNLLLREQAKLESDPAVQRKLIEQADAVRQRAIGIVRARAGARAPANEEDAGEPEAAPAPPSAGPFRVGGDVKAPVVRQRVEPVIPQAARDARIAGVVIIEAVIDREGRVSKARVLKPLPFGVDDAAVEAVKQWTFEPGTLNGQPVDVIFNLTVNVPAQ